MPVRPAAPRPTPGAFLVGVMSGSGGGFGAGRLECLDGVAVYSQALAAVAEPGRGQYAFADEVVDVPHAEVEVRGELR